MTADDEKASLIGVSLDDLGHPLIETRHRDGSSERHPFASTAVAKDQPQPQSWKHRGGALVEDERAGLTRAQRVEQSVRVEAALLKGMSSTSRASAGDHARAILVEVLTAMGHGWEERIAEVVPDKAPWAFGIPDGYDEDG